MPTYTCLSCGKDHQVPQGETSIACPHCGSTAIFYVGDEYHADNN